LSGQYFGAPSEDQTQRTVSMAGGEKTQGHVPRFLYQPGGVLLQLPAETVKVHPITFFHDDVVLGTLDIGPWVTFQKAVCRISEKLGVREDSVELRLVARKCGRTRNPLMWGLI